MYSPSQALGTYIVTNLHSFQVASQISDLTSESPKVTSH